ncbi:MAG: glycine cleavage system protein GcvH [Acidobacteriaceae bacterium]|nr:glycine cleavage system protein GcvH [Acidobacteriaceae bacterium]MBV8573302.1 glycine cleavage system protein GcvH [Acidobacteriaceae bacterium]
MSYPETYRYTKEHEWVHLDGNHATVGITEHAQHELGDIVFVDLPQPGTQVTKGHTFGSVESVKAVSDIYAPVSGQVLESNELLSKSPEKLNEDPHGDAWLIKISIASDPAEINALMSAGDYQKYVGAE